MNMTDPIADMLTRIRNGYQSKLVTVDVTPFSKVKQEIARILKSEGYISKYTVEGEGIEKKLVVTLKYTAEGERVMQGIKRISKPGLRIYAKSDNIPRVLNGLGVAIISTSEGMMTDRDARKKHIGGEVIAYVW